MKKTIIKNEKGITLIALVITIIVLLILAGVAISMLTGENGLINQAVASKTQTEKQSAIEEIRLAYLSALTGGQGEINYDILNEELAKIGYDRGTKGEDNSYSNDITSLPKTVTINEVTYEIQADGAVQTVENINSTNLAYDTYYYMSGNTNGQYAYLNSNGAIKTTLMGTERDATYTIEGEYVKFNQIDFFTEEEIKSFDEDTLQAYTNMKHEFKIVKGENNNFLISDNLNMLLATSTEGLKYIANGEKYVSGESYIIFNEGGYKYVDGSSSVNSYACSVVYYNGVIYSGDPTEEMTTTDNFETINWRGKTFTKSAE